ncbi:hypothetical protein BKE30_07420 [Alkanindiges hydrocarboniclasticus]|jgi:hypothetical protein|uniref:Uncharacterized protein n=1 Tax=Alkanindiges hydrocarboniclasticus TaxID=1907941 RepID=A0A1S8CVS8_9GAMM|nr:hypothetical protein [Alkanindiges hydrocarboniclasticus]ONG40564.1 hypothetical protein BKE30_07420 [Alkanindiges hydrocarboniclasticus]
MTGEQPEMSHAQKEKIVFRYSFEISGFKKSAGKGSIIVSDQLTDEAIKNLINEFVLGKIREFLKGKTIVPNGNFTINTSIEIIKITRLTPWNNMIYPGDESGQVTSRKFVVFMVGVAFVLLMFLFVFFNNSSLSSIKWQAH